MDTSNWRPAQGASGAVGDTTMESGDWRAQLEADSRENIVNKIMDTLKRHIPLSGHEGLQELKKIAVRFEETIYTAATSQSEYLRKTSLNILTMETRTQNQLSDPMQSNFAANSVIPWLPLDFTAQTVNRNGRGRQEEVYQKIKATKDPFLDSRPIQGADGAVGDPTLDSGDWRAQLQADSRQRIVNKILDTLKRHLPFSGHEGLQELRKIAVRFEDKIFSAATSQSDYLRKISLKMLTMESRSQHPTSDPMQSSSAANSVNLSVSLDSTVETNNPNGGDWQVEVYQKGASGAVGDPTLESGDWRTLLQGDSRQRIVNKIMDALKKHLPSSGHKGLKDMAVGFEENIYTASTSQSDYLGKISLKMLAMEARSQNPMSDPMQSNSAANCVNPSVPSNSTAQNGNPNGGDWREEEYQKKNAMKDPYLLDLNNIQQNLLSESQKMPIQQQNQLSSANLLPAQVQQSHPQLQQQVMPHTQSQPGQFPQQQVGIQHHPNLLQIDMLRRLATVGGFPQQNVINSQKRLCPQKRAMPEASSTSLDSRAQTGTNGGDWQEEVYQKIKAMKDLYLLDLNDMHQKIFSKLHQHDSLPQQPKNEQLEKLKIFKNMLERYIQFLLIPKHGIIASYKDKLGTYEKQIISVVNSNRRKPAAPQQQEQVFPPPHMQSQQTHSKLTQAQNGSVAPMQPNNMGNLQQHTDVSLSVGSNAQQNMVNSIQPSSNLDPGQNRNMNPLQQVLSGSQQQNIVNWHQVPNN